MHLLYHLTNRGFFSEINNFIIARIYAERLGVEFKYDDRMWSGKENLGLQDYFMVVDSERYYELPKYKSVFSNKTTKGSRLINLARATSNKVRKKVVEYYGSKNNIIVSHQYWREARLTFYSPITCGTRFVQPKDLIEKYANQYFTTNDRTTTEIRRKTSKIVRQLAGRKYIAVHIRRGDKIGNEMAPIPIEYYAEKIKERETMPVVLATDDFSVLTELERFLPQGYPIYTLCESNSRGWVEKDYRSRGGDIKRAEIINLLADVELMKNSQDFLGTYSSCVSQYVAAIRNFRDCVTIDTEWQFY